MNVNRQVILGAVGAILFFYVMWQSPIVAIAIGVLALFGLLNWLEQAWQLPKGFARWAGAIMIALTAAIQAWGWWTERYPIIGDAAGRRTNYAAMSMADILDPRYPNRLAVFLADAKRLRIGIEEQRCINQLSETMRNMTALQPHQPFRQDDNSVIAACTRRLERLRKELEQARYTPTIAARIAELGLGTKFLAFGALLGLIAAGLAIPKGTRKTAGWVGGVAILSVVVGVALLFFGVNVARAIAGPATEPKDRFEVVRFPPVAQASVTARGEGLVFLKGLHYLPTASALQPGQCARLWIEGAVQPGWEHMPTDRLPLLNKLYLTGLRTGRNPILAETTILLGKQEFRFEPEGLDRNICNETNEPQYIAFKTNGWGGSGDSLTVKITPQN